MITIDVRALDYIDQLEADIVLTDKKREEILNAIGKVLREDVEKRFMSSPATQIGGYVYPGDVFWAKLSDWYLNKRPDRRQGVILIDTGKLKESFIVDGAEGSVYMLDHENMILEYGSDLYYAGDQDERRPILVDHIILHMEVMQAIENAIIGQLEEPTI